MVYASLGVAVQHLSYYLLSADGPDCPPGPSFLPDRGPMLWTSNVSSDHEPYGGSLPGSSLKYLNKRRKVQ